MHKGARLGDHYSSNQIAASQIWKYKTELIGDKNLP